MKYNKKQKYHLAQINQNLFQAKRYGQQLFTSRQSFQSDFQVNLNQITLFMLEGLAYSLLLKLQSFKRHVQFSDSHLLITNLRRYSSKSSSRMHKEQAKHLQRNRFIVACCQISKEDHIQKIVQKIKLNNLMRQQDELNMVLQIINPWAVSNSKQIHKRDIISHYVCRLMFCLSQQKKDSFINYETLIFKSRLIHKTNINEKQLFQKLTEIVDNHSKKWSQIIEVNPQQLQQFKQQIFASARFVGAFGKFQPKRLYKVPMQSCEYLVSRRECFIHEGFCYLDGQMLLKVLPRIYSKYLRLVINQLQNQAQDILTADTDNQFRQFIRNQPSTIFNQVVSPQQLKQKLNLKNISIFSKRSFPPCMLQMYDVLITKKHLKHEARLQLTLFLKVAGLSQQDNQQLWKINYTKGVNESQQKEVLYNVRHSYGLQGKRTDYNSKDCDKIINSKPTSGQYHGCPFKYYEDLQLSKFLIAKYPSLDNEAVSIALQKKKKKQFQLACRSVFEKTHQDPKGKHLDLVKGVGRQPNMYFYQSQKYYQKFRK